MRTLRQILAEELWRVHTHLGLALLATREDAEGEAGREVAADQAEPAPATTTATEEAGARGSRHSRRAAGSRRSS